MVENTQQTTFFVKPRDAYRSQEIYNYLFRQLGSEVLVIERKFTTLPYPAWIEFYKEMGKRFPKELEEMAKDFSDKEIDLSLLGGKQIAQRVKRLVGPTNFEENPYWTIRGKFGPYILPQTIVHASDPENVEREKTLLEKYGALICRT